MAGLKNYFFILLFIIPFHCVWSQNTIGILTYEPEMSYEGYNLVFPHSQGTVWLLNECGEVVHKWEDNLDRVPGNSAYLLDNGDLLACYNRRGSNTDPIWAGGAGQYVELRTWENELIWQFELNDSLNRLHHDVTPMPNGNVLMIAWENKTPEEAMASGRDPLLITEGAVWPDYILEYNPALDSIVWTWHAWDHLVQDFDSSKLNFGMISEHPELININHIYASGQADWMHTNAIDYNPSLDLIMLSVPHFDEIWFIDHNTTSAQAKEHSGGYWGKGGDLVYRWGNPRAYHRGDTSDQKLFFSHDCHWVEDFIEEDYPYYGSVALFNNRYGSDYSAANIFTPVVDTVTRTFELINGGVWGPADYDITILHPASPQKMYSSGLSSFQILPNGNYLLLSGRNGYAFELTPTNDIAWEYIVPIKNGDFIPQGETALNNTTFRMKRYPPEFSAFVGKELSPIGYMELNPDTTYCDQLISLTNTVTPENPELYPNPANDMIYVEKSDHKICRYEIIDNLGRVVKSGKVENTLSVLPLENLSNGIYAVLIEGFQSKSFVIIR